MKIYNILSILAVVLVLCTMQVSATLGTFPQGSCVSLKAFPEAVNATLSTVSTPDSIIAISNKSMTQTAETYVYSFCNTTQFGRYIYDYYDSAGNKYVNDFYIGDEYGFWITLILGISAILLLAIGVFIRNEYIGLISGLLFLTLGVYGIINGFGYVNNVYTQSIAYTALGLGLIFFVSAIWEIIDFGGGGETDD